MRQFLAATALLALLGLPAVYFLDVGAARTVTKAAAAGAEVAGESADLDSVIAQLQHVAAGLAGIDDGGLAAPLLAGDGSANDGEHEGGFLTRTAALKQAGRSGGGPIVRRAIEPVAYEAPRRDRAAAADTVESSEEPGAAPGRSTVAALDRAAPFAGVPDFAYTPRYLRSSSAPGVVRAAFDLAGSFPDRRGLPRSYPTTFAWFDLV